MGDIIIIIIIIIGNITVNESVTKKLQNSTVSSKASKFSTACGRLSKYKQSLDWLALNLADTSAH